MHNYGSLSLRSFAQAALGFLATVRDGHPTVPLLVLSPVHGSDWREDSSCCGSGRKMKLQTNKHASHIRT